MGIQFTNQPVHENNCRLILNCVISTKAFVCIYQSTFALRNYKNKKRNHSANAAAGCLCGLVEFWID